MEQLEQQRLEQERVERERLEIVRLEVEIFFYFIVSPTFFIFLSRSNALSESNAAKRWNANGSVGKKVLIFLVF
jgi:hypothetical protein